MLIKTLINTFDGDKHHQSNIRNVNSLITSRKNNFYFKQENLRNVFKRSLNYDRVKSINKFRKIRK